MTQPAHLRQVAPPADGGDSPNAGRGPQRQRAAKAFPTDRMKMDRQIAVLRTLGRLSGPRKESVDGNALSKAVGGVAASTVILSNKFFADSGWITNSGKGLYSATDALVEYTRRLATGASDPAGVLREPARQSWYWQLLEPRLADGPVAANEAAILLMREAQATDSHMPMIYGLITWMELVGLVSVRDNLITAENGSSENGPQERAAEPQQPGDLDAPANLDMPAGTQGEKPTVPGGAEVPGVLVAFGLDVQLTVDDLVLLSPEQIKAFFEAVGTLAALKQKR